MACVECVEVFGRWGRKGVGVVSEGNVKEWVLVYVLVLSHNNFKFF